MKPTRNQRTVGMAVLIVVLLLTAACVSRPGRTALLTAAFLPEFLPGVPVRPLPLVTSPPARDAVTYTFTSSGEEYQVAAQLVRPAGGGRHSGVVIVLGVAPDLNDPVYLRVTEALARIGFVVLIPFPEYIGQQFVAPELTIGSLTGAVAYLAGRDDVDPARVGLAGFSVGSSLAAVAAADPAGRTQTAFLHWFGGYFDASDLLVELLARGYRADGAWMPWEPSGHAIELVRRQLINAVPDEESRALLERVYLAGGPQLSTEEQEALSPTARAVEQLLSAHTPEQVEAALAGLPPALTAALRALSPSTVAEQVRAPTYVLHEHSDPFVPFVESRRFWEALPPASRARFTETALFEHLSPRPSLETLELMREAAAIYAHLYGFFFNVL